MLSQILMLLGPMGKLWLACTSLKKSFDDQVNIKLFIVVILVQNIQKEFSITMRTFVIFSEFHLFFFRIHVSSNVHCITVGMILMFLSTVQSIVFL